MARSYHKPVHVLTVVLACAVFPLVIVGAGVTSKDAGMIFPDWPTSNGRLVNPDGWLENDAMRWEHGHRLLGWVVGMLAIACVATAWRTGDARRWLTLAALLAISIQGILGGLRVTEISTEFAMIHGIWGQACFCLACAAALSSSRTWLTRRATLSLPSGQLLARICLVTTAALFIQLTLGAALRHFGGDALLIAHLLWAVMVTLLVGWVVLWVIGNHPNRDLVELFGWALGVLMTVQLILGGVALIVTYMAPAPRGTLYWLVPSLHVAVGALVLATSVLLTLLTHRLLRYNARTQAGEPSFEAVAQT